MKIVSQVVFGRQEAKALEFGFRAARIPFNGSHPEIATRLLALEIDEPRAVRVGNSLSQQSPVDAAQLVRADEILRAIIDACRADVTRPAAEYGSEKYAEVIVDARTGQMRDATEALGLVRQARRHLSARPLVIPTEYGDEDEGADAGALAGSS